jgi:hypothetical protein
MPSIVRINVDNFGGSTFLGQHDINLNFYAYAQGNGSRDQCSLEIDDVGLALADE